MAVSRYLVPGERIISSFRRHSVVLGKAAATLVVALVLATVLWAEAPRRPNDHLGAIGAAVAVLGLCYFAWRAWQWRLARYLITNERIVLIEGLVARRINSLPLRLVIDTTYHRSVAGRLLGYCDLELNLSGQPGMRRLTEVPHADQVYRLLQRLLSSHGDGAAARAPLPGDTAPIRLPGTSP